MTPDASDNCTNASFAIGKQPHNQTQDGTTTLTGCDATLTDPSGAQDCRSGTLTNHNARWGYADVLVGNNTIYWNAETRAGYIEWVGYNNGEKSYWDENLNDMTGPPA